MRRRRAAALVVAVALDGHGELAPEASRAARAARDWRTRGSTTARRGGSRRACRSARSGGSRASARAASRGRRGGVLDVLRLVERDRRPVDARQQLGVAAQEAVARHAPACRGCRGMSARRRARARCRSAGRRRATARSARSRAPSCRPPRSARRAARAARRAALASTPMQQEGEELDRLAEAHVVGETRAEAERAHGRRARPARAPGTGAASPRNASGRGGAPRRRRAAARRSSASAPAADTATRQYRRARLARERRLRRASRAVISPAPLASRVWMSASSRGSTATHCAAKAHERRLLPGERGELARRERLVAERGLPVEREQLVEPEPGRTRHRAGDLA